MREPWKKHGGWPYEGRRGKTWQLGYRDHEGRVRSKSFKTKTARKSGPRDYVDAERRNRLREFLLGSDAPEVQPDTTPVGELILDWLATDAHPDSPGGLARSTLGQLPLDRLTPHHRQPGRATHEEDRRDRRGRAGDQAARPEGRLRHRPPTCSSTSRPQTSSSDGCRRCATAGVSRSTEAKAWKVISSALSWAVEDDSWPLSTNGCLTMQRRRGMRRASRRAGTGAIRQVSPGKRRDDLAVVGAVAARGRADPARDAGAIGAAVPAPRAPRRHSRLCPVRPRHAQPGDLGAHPR